MSLRVDRESEVPVGAQLAWALRSKIEAGELGPGDRLPSLRDVAADAGVNVNTVRAAYAKLEVAGIVRTEQGRGTFVTSPASGDDASRRRELRAARAEIVGRVQAERLGPAPRRPSPRSSSSLAGARVRWTSAV